LRILKVGTRGEDVLLWQHFLMQLRATAEATFTGPVIRLDGIFGRETRRATTAFQQRYQLRVDGIVGRETFKTARELGFGRIAAGSPVSPEMEAAPAPPGSACKSRR